MRLIGEVFCTDDLRDKAKEEAEVPLVDHSDSHLLNDARRTIDKQRSEARGFLDELNTVAKDVNHCYINTDDLCSSAAPKAQKEKLKTRLTIVPKRKVA